MGRACSVDHENKLVQSVGVIRNEGKYYKGIRRAVITIGNLLNTSVLLRFFIFIFRLGAGLDGSLGPKACKPTDGYMMSPIVNFNFPYKFEWSECSIRMIKAFMDPSSSRAACLFKEPSNSSIDLSNIPLPGQLLRLDKFCSHLLGYKYAACHVSCIYDIKKN